MYKGDVYNPHQNININISYNLNTDKLPKSLFGKKISKINKVVNPKISPQIDLKQDKKNIQNVQKRSNQIKKSSLQGKKMKKKQNKQLIRNTLSPQLYVQRKLKTEASCNEQMTSTFKKQHKLKKSGHLKSIQTNFIQSSNKTFGNKKILSQSKTPKNNKKIKQNHNKSCMLYSTKKQLINLQSNLQGAQHIISTCLAAPQRKRIQSAITFKNDTKIVSKFLNMSMISSQLGGSQLISSERLRQPTSQDSQPHKALKQYLNSIDMRIMKNIQQDKKIVSQNRLNYLFIQKPGKSSGKQSLIKELLKIKKISLEEFQKKVVIIQRRFRKLKKRSVLSFYKQMFKKVSEFEYQIDESGRKFSKISPQKQFRVENNYNNSIQISKQIQNIKLQRFQLNSQQQQEPKQINFIKQSRFDQISDIDQNSQKLNDDSRGSGQIQLNFIQNDFFQSGKAKINQSRKAKINYKEKEKNYQEKEKTQKPPSLNFQRYKQLVQNQIKQNKKKHGFNIQANRQNLSKFKEQQIQEWNSINRLISSNMREKNSPLSNNQLLDKLIQQSKLNKQWIEQQISANQTLNNSHQVSFDSNAQLIADQRKTFIQQAQLYSKQQEDESSQKQSAVDVEVEDSLTMIEEYDSKKYSLNLHYENNQNSSCDGSPPLKFNQSSLFDKEQELDRRWINRQLELMDNTFKQSQRQTSYLDCSLNGFGINLNDYTKKQEKKQNLILNIEKRNIRTNEPLFEELSDFVRQDSSLHVSAQSSVSGQDMLLYDNQGHNQTQKDINQQIKKKKLVRVIEDLILDLIRQFAYDISSILKKNSGISVNKIQNQNLRVNNVPVPQQRSPKVLGVNTSYISVKDYLQQFKAYILSSEETKKKIMANINKDIGPNSLQILSYLRPEAAQFSVQQTNDGQPSNMDENQNLEDEEGLFVVPSETFEQFQDFLQIQQSKKQAIQLTTRQKAFLNFWHRSIFQSFNEYLDYERPYGITGKPYDWISERKKPKIIQRERLEKCLQKAIDKLLESMMFLSGIIFEKMDSPFTFVDQQNRQMINQQRLSRMLATQLFQSQQSWINYNDQSAELQVQLSRMIQQKIFFQVSSQLKRVSRKRKLLVEESGNCCQQKIQFQYQEV